MIMPIRYMLLFTYLAVLAITSLTFRWIIGGLVPPSIGDHSAWPNWVISAFSVIAASTMILLISRIEASLFKRQKQYVQEHPVIASGALPPLLESRRENLGLRRYSLHGEIDDVRKLSADPLTRKNAKALREDIET